VKQSVERGGCGSRRPAAAHAIIYPLGFEPSSPRLPIFPQSSSLFCFPLFPIFILFFIIKTSCSGSCVVLLFSFLFFPQAPFSSFHLLFFSFLNIP
jgi:hypothetical protein